MKRRRFIELSAYSAAAISIPLLNGCKPKLINKAVAQPPLLSHMFDVKTLEETGNAYLKVMSSENSLNKLEENLLENSSITEASDVETVHSFFDKKIKEDFETGKMVILNGWILSVTEARQCALFALTQS